MFLGFKLLFLLIISPLLVWIIIIGLKNRRNSNGKIILTTAIVSLGVLIFSISYTLLSRKITLEKDDFYGEYVIDRNYFSGKNADWQYNHFRFEITEDDSIFFYVIEKEKLIQSYPGIITTVKPYNSERLVIQMEKPTHQILDSNPTIYREAWGFYLVFNSPKFSNMYFRKGEWKNIDNK